MKAINKLVSAISILGLILFAVSFLFPELQVLGGTGIGLAIVSGTFNPKFTFNDLQIASFKELIYEDVFEKADLRTFFTIQENIKAGKKIGIVQRMTEIGRSKGACDTTETDIEIPTIQKAWAPCSWGDRIPFCAADLEDQFIVWALNSGLRRSDLTDTDYADFISEQVSDGMLESLYKLTFFGDVDAETVDGSPAGNLTSGTDKELFNCHDGIWKQVFAIVAADANRKISIAKNAEATYADQEFDSTDITNKVASVMFRDLIQKSTLKARANSNRIILCTQSLADQYTNELENASGVIPSWEIISNGVTMLKRQGKTIVAIPKWDDIIRTYFDNGTKYHLPHRALMVDKANMVIGVDSEGALSELEMFYDKRYKKNYVDFLAKIDTKIIQDIMVQAAY